MAMTTPYRHRRWVCIAVAATLVWLGCADHSEPTTNPVRTMDADQFTQMIAADNFSGLVVVFATWCFPCREELPEVADAFRSLSAPGIQIIAASVDDGQTSQVQSLVNRLKLPFPVYHVGTGLIPKFRIIGVPTLLLVNKGLIVENSPGQQSSESLEAKIKKLSDATP
jgi:thiol-disulfide isomerase/thioredoxin